MTVLLILCHRYTMLLIPSHRYTVLLIPSQRYATLLCHMLPRGARVTCYPWDARCSGYGSNLADWLTSSWLKVIEATRTVHAKVMMRLRAGCPLFWLRVEPG